MRQCETTLHIYMYMYVLYAGWSSVPLTEPDRQYVGVCHIYDSNQNQRPLCLLNYFWE